MDSTDLFSFLEQDPDALEEDLDELEVVDVPTRKRKAEKSAEEPVQNGEPSHSDENGVGSPSYKKQRIASPTPMVLDEVEVEAKREVKVSAGLMSAETDETGPRLELRHQVRHFAGCLCSSTERDWLKFLQVRHQVAVPPGYPYIPISKHVPPAKPAREYKFTLDPFQQLSVNVIQRSESVLVSAHTSAGKTVVAEYAIAQCLQNKQRVIYTSPIKALSNQKYRDMRAEFGDVGLMTGDVTIDPSSTCLVMTTEVRHNKLKCDSNY